MNDPCIETICREIESAFAPWGIAVVLDPPKAAQDQERILCILNVPESRLAVAEDLAFEVATGACGSDPPFLISAFSPRHCQPGGLYHEAYKRRRAQIASPSPEQAFGPCLPFGLESADWYAALSRAYLSLGSRMQLGDTYAPSIISPSSASVGLHRFSSSLHVLDLPHLEPHAVASSVMLTTQVTTIDSFWVSSSASQNTRVMATFRGRRWDAIPVYFDPRPGTSNLHYALAA